MREKKFRGLVEQTENRKRYWVYYGVGSKPALIGARWLVEDCQYIELYDKAGIEIFEGDIARYLADGRWKTGSIIWQRGGYAIHVVKYGTEPMDAIFEFQAFIATPRNGNAMGYGFQVIGNVFENPELVKEIY